MDLALVALAASLAVAPAERAPEPSLFVAGPRIAASRIRPAAVPGDTIIEYSNFYYQRLTVHRWASYTMLPLFVAQYVVGSKLYDSGSAEGNKDAHEMLAAATAGLFGINTVTGLWNLWDGRADPNERGRKLTHSVLMLLADAGFVATGILADGAEDGAAGGASTHRAVAIGSMALSTASWLIMTDLFRK